MSNKQQTAVKWLIKKLSTELIGEIPLHRWDEIRECVQQAKEMEKQQIISAYLSGKINGVASTIQNELNKPSEQYYKETYGESKCNP